MLKLIPIGWSIIGEMIVPLTEVTFISRSNMVNITIFNLENQVKKVKAFSMALLKSLPVLGTTKHCFPK